MTVLLCQDLRSRMPSVYVKNHTEIHIRNQNWSLCLEVMLPLIQVEGKKSFFTTKEPKYC